MSLAALSLVSSASAEPTGSTRIWLNLEQTATLGEVAFGQGLEGVATASTGATIAGGRVRWVLHRVKDDHLGMHHAYYRQTYSGPGLAAAPRLVGSHLALHWAPDGTLRFATGAQFTDVSSVSAVNLASASDAFAATQAGLALRPGFEVGNPADWGAGTLPRLLERAELALESVGDGRSFRPVWSILTADRGGIPYTVRTDATSGAVLGLRREVRSAAVDCHPGSAALYPARAVPQNEDVRGQGPWPVAANHNPDVPGSYVYEAVWPGNEQQGVTQVEVYQFTDNYDHWCIDLTDSSAEGRYRRIGLLVRDGYPTYDKYESRQGQRVWDFRNSAGEAMYFTSLTMQTLSTLLEHPGFTGSYGDPARIVVDHGVNPCLGVASYFPEFVPGHHTPQQGVCFGRPVVDWSELEMSAAIDIVAHEWGHGVSHHNLNFGGVETSDPDDLQALGELEEAFADFIGHVVEWANQDDPDTPGAFQLGRRDWRSGEDWNATSCAARRADLFDQRNDCPGWKYSLHAEDTYEDPGGTAHNAAPRLGVVFMLLADGGPDCAGLAGCRNPICLAPSPPAGACDYRVHHLGFEDAARLLFRTLTVYATETEDVWEHLADHANQAAMDLYWLECYGTCQQHEVSAAFAAIGYPKLEPFINPFGACDDYPCETY